MSHPHTDTVDASIASGAGIDVRVGTVLAGRYEILDVLGAGGMGTVTRAHDRELDEVVALKLLHVGAATPGAIDAIRREVKLARRVTHRNVARTFELGEDRGVRFITMELVRGEPLAKMLERRGALSPDEAVPILVGVCDGLAAAHAASVVHRDVKPENVLLEETGRVVVTDFGIAREHDPADLRGTQHAAGTPLYMAPEQIEGGPTTPRTDLYALGVMAYEMVIGEPPWSGSALAAMSRRLVEPPPDPRVKRPELPASLGAAILRCMARDPAERFADARTTRDAFCAVSAKAASRPPMAVVVAPALASPRTIAVLPFKHAGTADAHVVDAMGEDLVDALSSSKGVRVLSRSALPKDASGDPLEIGKRLALDHVVEGQVRRDGDTFRVSVRLVEVATGFVAWAQRFDLSPAQLLSAQDEIARAVTAALGASAGAARQAPSDVTAIELYLRARRHYHSFAIADANEAVTLLEQAIAHAPTNAVLRASLSLTLQRRLAAGADDPTGWERASREADEAVRLAPDLGEGHFARAQRLLNAGDPLGAARSARIAVKNAPSLAEAHELLGRLLLEAARVADATVRFDVADRLDPELVHVTWERARLAALEGDWERFDMHRARWEQRHRASSAHLIYDVRYAAWRGDRVALEAIDAAMPQHRSKVSGMLGQVVQDILDVYLGRTRARDMKEFSTTSPRLLQWSAQMGAELAGFDGDPTLAARRTKIAADAGLFDLLWLERCPLLDRIRTQPDYLAATALVRARADSIVEAVWS